MKSQRAGSRVGFAVTLGSRLLIFLVLAITAAGLAGARDDEPASWDGLKRVDLPGLDTVYLREGASLSRYSKVMLDPVDVSFDKNWDPKGTGSVLSRQRVDTQAIRENLAKLARDVTRRELGRNGGYPLVDEPGEDVLRVRAQIVDLYINAPDTMTPGTRTYVVNAGEMTLVAELYDSQTNTLIARVVDRRRGMERGPYDLQIANRVTNMAEADRILSGWARRLKDALDKARQAAH